jgi:hypothetical protein
MPAEIEKGYASWTEYISIIYAIYKSDLADANLTYHGMQVKLKTDIDYTLRQESFEFVPNSVEIESDSSGYSLIDYR